VPLDFVHGRVAAIDVGAEILNAGQYVDQRLERLLPFGVGQPLLFGVRSGPADVKTGDQAGDDARQNPDENLRQHIHSMRSQGSFL